MENASKALIMAGAILIGVMVLSTAVMLVRMFGNFGNETAEKLNENKLHEFNAQFTKFINTKATAHDIVTLANLANQNNIDLLDDPKDITNPSKTQATKNNLFVNICVKYQGKYVDEGGSPANIEKNIPRFDLENQTQKDSFIDEYSIQRQYPEKAEVAKLNDIDTLLDTTKNAEPLPVYFLCTSCKISENTKRVYYMEFQSYYYRTTSNLRKKGEIITNISG